MLLTLVRKRAPLDTLVPFGGATCDDYDDNQSGCFRVKFVFTLICFEKNGTAMAVLAAPLPVALLDGY